MPKQTFFNLSEEKQSRIVRVAREEFAKAPYQNISINHLIKCMNIPTGSFYQYFEDKKDLYFYILSFYINGLLEEAVDESKKINLFDIERNRNAPTYFTKVKKMEKYQEIFVDNLEKAPIDIKRDWTFEKLIGGKYMNLYDYSFFDDEAVDPYVKQHKYLMLGVALALPNVVHRFLKTSDFQEELELYELCLKVLKVGILNFKSEEKSEEI